MPAAPRIVTGNVKTLAGLARAGIEVTFVRTGAGDVFGQNDEVVVNEPIKATSGEGGALSVTLYPGSYSILCSGANGPKRATMALTEDGSTDLTDLIGQAAPLLRSAAELARDKAREWATNPEDDPVEPGEFSALHWAAKAQSLGAVEVEKARVWAENPEDDEVAAGQFSALHHAAKSAASAGEAADSAAAAAVSETNAAASEAAAELAATDTAASVVSYGAIRDQIEADRAEIAVNKDLAYGYQQSAAAAVAYQNLSAVALSKAETAVDVFVYDTSKDSDGGAWRKRCQHTSWYNETLNTATRGARREFPAVAVIVAESNKVTIYDGDDPSLPMWMVFIGTTAWNYMFTFGNAPAGVTSVACLNGRLAITTTSSATNASTNGVFEIVFPADTGFKTRSVGRYKWQTNIADRNASTTASWLNNTIIGPAIVSDFLNDVAMTVLPDAPVDPATGLPVPTIAVATAGGLSVINQDGTVTNLAWGKPFGFALFDAAGDIYTCDTVFNLSLALYSRNAANVYSRISALLSNTGSNQGSQLWAASLTQGRAAVSGRTLSLAGSSTTGGCRPGLQRYFRDTVAMNCLITTTYNTGWLVGDTKGAFLSSKDTASLVGADIVQNGDFATGDLTGFQVTTGDPADWSAASGVAVYSGSVLSFLEIRPGNANPPIGQYILEAKVTGAYNGVYVNSLSAYVGGATVGGVTRWFIDQRSQQPVKFVVSSPGFSVDDIKLFKADDDRSMNAKGLVVNGTITRAPVAAGAELVGYSGFSLANYLEQPYNSALDFGTGDFCVMGWAKISSNGNQTLIERYDGVTAASRFGIYASGAALQAYIGGWRSSSYNFQAGQWAFVVGLRTAGVFQLFVDGLQVYSGNHSDNLTGAANVTRIGLDIPSAWPLGSGSIALWRIGATAPTPEQIRRIYEDERPLFQPGAACTLFGASDSVKALAYDTDTDLLHVGTSAGRSVFKGLRRVSNTAVAVGAAISAVNGLVVEE